jgi:hypothetical protein
MQKLYISPTPTTPEINFSPEENIFIIRGTSAPEDVREVYYPVIDWFKKFTDSIIEGSTVKFTPANPFILKIDLEYFNSSSAKFLYDIFFELRRFAPAGIPFSISWYYDEDDVDMKEAGYDISLLVETEFVYIPKIS